MKNPTYKVKKESGRYYVLVRKPGHNYYERIGGAFFSDREAKAWIAALTPP